MRYLTKKNKAIFTQIVKADFKLKYQGSVLGYLWSLLKPLFMFLVLYMLFGVILKVDSGMENYPIYLLMGIVLWWFFTDSTSNGLQAIVARGELVKKIRIPRWIIILSTNAGAIITFAFGFLVVIIFAIFNQLPLMMTMPLIIFPIILIFLFSLGLSLWFSAAYVKYRDVSYIWDVVAQAGFYATPILYVLGSIKDVFLQKILILNPVAYAIQEARYYFVSKDTATINQIYNNDFAWLMPVAIVIVTLWFGLWYFRKESSRFAENL